MPSISSRRSSRLSMKEIRRKWSHVTSTNNHSCHWKSILKGIESIKDDGFDWTRWWKLKMHPRFLLLVWKFIYNCLPTKVVLHKSPSPLTPIFAYCASSLKNRLFIYFMNEMLQDLWSLLALGLNWSSCMLFFRGFFFLNF